MLHSSSALVIAAMLSVVAACDSGRHTTAGFSMPADANLERGRQAFSDLGCPACHRVVNLNLPSPTVQPAVPVVLGGEIDRKLSDAYLVTAMISPSHQLALYPKEQVTSGGMSRMPNHTDKMSVRQMVDLVAFLQSRYIERPMLPTYDYH